MSEKNSKKQTANSRRSFIKNATLAAVGFYIIPRHVLGRGFIAPSDKLTIASIGVGGKGGDDINHFYKSGKANFAALCDVDDRRAAKSRELLPNAKYYKDFREMLDKEGKSIDAVSVGTPDHTHAVAAMAAMQLGKHVYVQKPLTHDIYEARMLTQAAHKYRVVTQMGNQGASSDGVRQLIDWYKAGVIGNVHTVYCFTDRPVWPQGIERPTDQTPIPAELDFDLWLGTAPKKNYFDGLLPFNWRGWWDYGTGALGDMGCHLMAEPFQVLELGYPIAAECSVATRYTAPWKKAYYPESGPVSSHIILTFKGKKQDHADIKLHWMDGGIQPERPEELLSTEEMGDGGNAVIFIGTKGKMMCSTYGLNPQLLPTSKTAVTIVPQTIARVPGEMDGHYTSWIEASMAGYGSDKANALSSRFDVAGPLTESVLMGNLAIRSYDIQKLKPVPTEREKYDYPGRYIELLWDGDNMKITNFDDANQFVKRTYRDGWSLGV
jgi:predicted dehydrogenase